MSTEIDGPGGSKGGAPRSESKMVDCRGQSLLDSAAWPVAVPDIFLGFQKPSSAIDRCHSLSSLALPPAALASLPLGRLLWYLSCRNKKDTRRRHQHQIYFKILLIQYIKNSTGAVECGKNSCGLKFSNFCLHRPCGKLSKLHRGCVEKKSLRL